MVLECVSSYSIELSCVGVVVDYNLGFKLVEFQSLVSSQSTLKEYDEFMKGQEPEGNQLSSKKNE